MNFLTHQAIANGGHLPRGPHFVHCCIYEGQHCSCGGNYQGPNPGPSMDAAVIVEAAVGSDEK
ncbi:hypothetical protein ACWERI_34255 [Streptomyces collinus]